MKETHNQRLESEYILGPQIIGPLFFERTQNSDVYEDFLLNILPHLLKNVLLNVRIGTMIVQIIVAEE